MIKSIGKSYIYHPLPAQVQFKVVGKGQNDDGGRAETIELLSFFLLAPIDLCPTTGFNNWTAALTMMMIISLFPI